MRSAHRAQRPVHRPPVQRLAVDRFAPGSGGRALALLAAAVLHAGPALGDDSGRPATAAPPDLFAAVAAATVVDLSHAYDQETIYWPTEDGFQLETSFAGHTEKGYYYEASSFCSAEHGGTHLDAPIHFAEGRQAAHEIPLERLIGPAAVVDVAAAAAADPSYQVTVADLRRFEADHGRLPDGAIVLLNTGFARHWPDRERYMGTALRGPEGVARLQFPGLHPDAARWLVAERSIGAIGLDTPSIDHGPSKEFWAHRVLFEANIPAFENVAQLDRLPATGALVFALPMKIRGGSGGPLRIIALVP